MAQLQRDKFERELERQMRLIQREKDKHNKDEHSENFTVSFIEIQDTNLMSLKTMPIIASGKVNTTLAEAFEKIDNGNMKCRFLSKLTKLFYIYS